MRSKKAAAIMLCAVLGTSMATGVSVSAKDKDELVLYTWDGMVPQALRQRRGAGLGATDAGGSVGGQCQW